MVGPPPPDNDMNRYAAQVVAGSPLVRQLKRLKWWLRQPRGLARLGPNSRIFGELRRINSDCIEIGDRVLIGQDCLMQPIRRYLDQHFSPRLVIGDDCYVGPDCQFHCTEGITLGRGCVLSDQIYISDVGHGMDPRHGLIMDQPVSSKGPVSIGDGCFLGFGAVVLSGVTLGAHCVVGTRSVVTRSFPARTMLVGNPARVIACFDEQTGLWSRVGVAATKERQA